MTSMAAEKKTCPTIKIR